MWQSCSAVLPPGSPRAGQVCAAGLGNATSTMTPGQSSPSLSGASARFILAGPTGYSNELWWNSLGPRANVSHFVYDLWFYIDNPQVVQALEFDVNQAFGGTRWTWGTECNFKDTGKWDVWNALGQVWVATSVPCKPFRAKTWIHLVWNFERVKSQMRYVSVAVNDVTSALDLYYTAQPNWPMDDLNVAFQMDGDYRQDPYAVWLDKVNLMVW